MASYVTCSRQRKSSVTSTIHTHTIRNIILENSKLSANNCFMLSFCQMPSYLLPTFLLHLWESSLMAEKEFLPWLLLKPISLPHGRQTSSGHSTATAENVTKTIPGFTKHVSRHCAGNYGVKEKQIRLAFHK